MGFKTWVAGDVLTAADQMDYLMKQAVIVCTSGTRPSSPVEGMTIKETDTNRELTYDGAAWIRTNWFVSSGRTGGTWTRGANLSIANGTEVDLTWPTEVSDSDGFLTPTSATLTIPAGLGGFYYYDLRYTWASSPGNGGLYVFVGAGIVHTPAHSVPSSTVGGHGGVLTLAAADTVKFQVVQNSGGAVNINPATLNFYRLAI